MSASGDPDWDVLDSISVSLYDEPSYPSFDVRRVAEYLSKKVGVQVVIKGRLLHPRDPTELERASRILVSSRILDPARRAPNEPTRAELEQEERQLVLGRVTPGIVYDGLAVQRLMQEFVEGDQRRIDHLHIAFTNRLLATYERPDSRYHLRTILCGYPCVVSLPGLVAAPARKPAYYLSRERSLRIGLTPPTEDAYADDHLAYGDSRTTDVAVGYVMQAVSYAVLGYPFCREPGCRLFDAHRQIEMLEAQLEPPEYCGGHMPFLAEYRRAKQEEGHHEHHLR